MTNLKKSMLAMSIMAMPFAASAEMQALGDQDMGSITGQAGVSIELETQVNIGQFIYTDEGSFSISDIAIGGSDLHNLDDDDSTQMFTEITGANRDLLELDNTSDLIDDIVINIDIADDGDALIEVRPSPNQLAPVDFAVTAGEMRLGSQDGSTSTLVANNLSVRGLINRLDIFVDSGADSARFQMQQNGITEEINIHTIVAIDDLDVDISMLGVGIRDFRMTGAGYLYGDDANPSIATLGADIKMSIYADQRADGGDALAVDLQNFEADMEIGQVLIGGASIGTIGIDNLSVQNTQMRVYGRE
jgi:hypothetical protein